MYPSGHQVSCSSSHSELIEAAVASGSPTSGLTRMLGRCTRENISWISRDQLPRFGGSVYELSLLRRCPDRAFLTAHPPPTANATCRPLIVAVYGPISSAIASTLTGACCPVERKGPEMAYRVIQWSTGGVGRAAIEGVINHPDLELAGCWVHSSDKSGVDVGVILGREPVGVVATSDIDSLFALEADCVIYSPLFADPLTVDRLLESGKNVVTPLGWFFPQKEERDRVDVVCRRAGTTLHGTGIDPGGITERFPLMVSALAGSVTRVRAEEFSDIRTYGAPDVIRDWMLFGAEPEMARTSIMADALGAGFRQAVWMVAHELGFDIEPQLRTTHEMAVATSPIDSPIGPIAPGLVAAQRFRWEGLIDGEPVITAAVNWLMGDKDLDPPWRFGAAGERFEVEVSGDPGVFVTFKKLHPASIEEGLRRNPGIVATAMHLVNAVPYVCEAEPGLKTYLDLPLVAGRATPGLGKGRR